MLSSLVVGLAFYATALAAPHSARNNNGRPYVTIKNGTVRGIDNPTFGQQEFLGIPYAQPPVGDLRLRPAKPLAQRFGDFDASAYSPACYSAYGPAYDDNSGYESSEDCLTINVVRSYGVYKGEGGRTVPVVVWIHGGGFTTGHSGDKRYNSSAYVEASVANGQPMVFVSMNYRLASFGFMGGKALAEDNDLNLGVRDQRLALHWVQENIAEFGGDPNQVTIQGESAGGFSVVAQAVAYGGKSNGLFHRAMIQSGGGLNAYPMPGSGAYQQNYDNLLGNSSCASTKSSPYSAQLACIRQLPADEFRRLSNGTTGLTYDGDFFREKNAVQSFEKGAYTKVPFFITSNTDEGVSFGPKGSNSTEQTTAFIEGGLGAAPASAATELLSLYPNNPALGCPFNTFEYDLDPFQNGGYFTPGSQNKRVAAITGDLVMQAGPRYWSERFTKDGLDVYRGMFNHIPWTISYGIENYVGHFTEVSYAFNLQNNDTAFWEKYHFTATYLGPGAPIQDRALGDYMSRSWAAFVTDGNPNAANFTGKPYWPSYKESPSVMRLQTQGNQLEKDDYREDGIRYIIDNIFLKA